MRGSVEWSSAVFGLTVQIGKVQEIVILLHGRVSRRRLTDVLLLVPVEMVLLQQLLLAVYRHGLVQLGHQLLLREVGLADHLVLDRVAEGHQGVLLEAEGDEVVGGGGVSNILIGHLNLLNHLANRVPLLAMFLVLFLQSTGNLRAFLLLRIALEALDGRDEWIRRIDDRRGQRAIFE